ncbi:uncharacterized protein LOC115229179 [Octopus sinensis]|uniref:Uncharacterized protein LOC115229179 n=1 Tax=Octopus sinensis TaxID=2607531 RepID=A0A6P7TZS2_9MOLL|nr:uncharacterized protein LOC115229179 [Octopus sinensis]
MDSDFGDNVPSMANVFSVDDTIQIDKEQLETFIPSNGDELLAMIQAERWFFILKLSLSFMPNVTFSEPIKHVQILNDAKEDTTSNYPDNILPSKDFHNFQINHFKSICDKFSQTRQIKNYIENTIFQIPCTKKDWNEYFLSQLNQNISKSEPKLSTICQLKPKDIFRALCGLYEWMKVQLFTDSAGEWLYSLLVALVPPLHPDMHSLLRDINRIFIAERRSFINESFSHKILDRINIFIIIISDYFGQSDMLLM